MYFKEFETFTTVQIICFVLGVVTVFIGVYVLSYQPKDEIAVCDQSSGGTSAVDKYEGRPAGSLAAVRPFSAIEDNCIVGNGALPGGALASTSISGFADSLIPPKVRALSINIMAERLEHRPSMYSTPVPGPQSTPTSLLSDPVR